MTQLVRAANFIKSQLQNQNEIAVKQIQQEAKSEDIAWSTINLAKTLLPIKTKKRKDGWTWKLDTNMDIIKSAKSEAPEQREGNSKFVDFTEPDKTIKPAFLAKAKLILDAAFKQQSEIEWNLFRQNLSEAGHDYQELRDAMVFLGLRKKNGYAFIKSGE